MSLATALNASDAARDRAVASRSSLIKMFPTSSSLSGNVFFLSRSSAQSMQIGSPPSYKAVSALQYTHCAMTFYSLHDNLSAPKRRVQSGNPDSPLIGSRGLWYFPHTPDMMGTSRFHSVIRLRLQASRPPVQATLWLAALGLDWARPRRGANVLIRGNGRLRMNAYDFT
jgi:hypothetical protein